MNNLEVENQITNDISIENKQRNFLQTNIGKAVNTGLNIGLRYILPDVIDKTKSKQYTEQPIRAIFQI